MCVQDYIKNRDDYWIPSYTPQALLLFVLLKKDNHDVWIKSIDEIDKKKLMIDRYNWNYE